MSLRKLPVAVAASALAMSSVAAHAAPVQRSSSPAAEENELSRSFLWIIVAIGIVVGLILLLDDDDAVSA